ncbi:MAG: DnaJ domain-containing protein [Rhizobiales bacterium]|nr:DnaJ domain-containing protein [Hyphomicrobiales bacterium]
MPQFLIALIIVVGGLWLIRKSARMPPQAARGFVQKLAGSGIMAFAGLLALRGQMNLAIGVFLFGLGLVGKTAVFPNGFPWGGQKSAGQKSRVATAYLSMELDHDSGSMDGDVLAGPSKGKRLSRLTDTELMNFHGLCGGSGDQSRALLEAWLDRNRPEWRQAWGGGAGAAPSAAGRMSKDEAYAVLGLKSGASADEVRAAHRRLMKEFHPDKGGTDYLAAKINAAKDVLLGT